MCWSRDAICPSRSRIRENPPFSLSETKASRTTKRPSKCASGGSILYLTTRRQLTHFAGLAAFFCTKRPIRDFRRSLRPDLTLHLHHLRRYNNTPTILILRYSRRGLQPQFHILTPCGFRGQVGKVGTYYSTRREDQYLELSV
jgi:hypothetical protein